MSVIFLAVGTLIYLRADPTTDQNVIAQAFWGGLLVTAASPLLAHAITRIVAHRRRRHLAIAARGASASVWLAALLVGVIAFLCALAASIAQNAHAFGMETYQGLQPSESIVIERVDRTAVDLVTRMWHGDSQSDPGIFLLPDETTHSIRVSSPAFAACISSLIGESIGSPEANACPLPTDSMVPVNQVAIGAEHSPGWRGGGIEVLAEQALISDGSVGLVSIDTVDGTILNVRIEPAVADGALGGLLPGAVLGSGSEATEALDLQPSGFFRMSLDASDLPSTRSITEMAASLRSIVPTAEISIEQGFDDGGLLAWAVFLTSAGSATIAAIVLVVGLGLVERSQTLRFSLAALSARKSLRFWIGVLAMSDVVVCLVVAPVLVVATARLWTSTADVTHGVLFLVPPSVGLICAAIVVSRFARVARAA